MYIIVIDYTQLQRKHCQTGVNSTPLNQKPYNLKHCCSMEIPVQWIAFEFVHRNVNGSKSPKLPMQTSGKYEHVILHIPPSANTVV